MSFSISSRSCGSGGACGSLSAPAAAPATVGPAGRGRPVPPCAQLSPRGTPSPGQRVPSAGEAMIYSPAPGAAPPLSRLPGPRSSPFPHPIGAFATLPKKAALEEPRNPSVHPVPWALPSSPRAPGRRGNWGAPPRRPSSAPEPLGLGVGRSLDRSCSPHSGLAGPIEAG